MTVFLSYQHSEEMTTQRRQQHMDKFSTNFKSASLPSPLRCSGPVNSSSARSLCSMMSTGISPMRTRGVSPMLLRSVSRDVSPMTLRSASRCVSPMTSLGVSPMTSHDVSPMMSYVASPLAAAPPRRPAVLRRRRQILIDTSNISSPQSSTDTQLLTPGQDVRESRFTLGDPSHSVTASRCQAKDYSTLTSPASSPYVPASVTSLPRSRDCRSVDQNSSQVRRSLMLEEEREEGYQEMSTADLTGDFTRRLCLPGCLGRRSDLNCITPDTVTSVLRGDYNDVIDQFLIIDCRYPYEYIGGHIKGAINVSCPTDCQQMLLSETAALRQTLCGGLGANKRVVIIFHCEFSSKRGPNMARHLRNIDRAEHIDSYPYLQYPEIYLLEGGYKAFYQSFPEHCTPRDYVPMDHPRHVTELAHFRSKSSRKSRHERKRPTITAASLRQVGLACLNL